MKEQISQLAIGGSIGVLMFKGLILQAFFISDMSLKLTMHTVMSKDDAG